MPSEAFRGWISDCHLQVPISIEWSGIAARSLYKYVILYVHLIRYNCPRLWRMLYRLSGLKSSKHNSLKANLICQIIVKVSIPSKHFSVQEAWSWIHEGNDSPTLSMSIKRISIMLYKPIQTNTRGNTRDKQLVRTWKSVRFHRRQKFGLPRVETRMLASR